LAGFRRFPPLLPHCNEMRTGARHSQSSGRVLHGAHPYASRKEPLRLHARDVWRARAYVGRFYPSDPDLPLSTTTDILTAVAQAVPRGREAHRADTTCLFLPRCNTQSSSVPLSALPSCFAVSLAWALGKCGNTGLPVRISTGSLPLVRCFCPLAVIPR